jgi:hypothetical protein
MSKNYIEKFYNQNNIIKSFIKNVSNNEQKNDNNINKNLSQTINFNYKYSIIINNNDSNNNENILDGIDSEKTDTLIDETSNTNNGSKNIPIQEIMQKIRGS